MAELVLLGLTALAGYMLKQNSNETTQAKRFQVHSNELPSGVNAYESNRVEEVHQFLQDNADRNYLDAQQPQLTSVIPPHFNQINFVSTGEPAQKNIGNSMLPTLARNDTVNKLTNVAGGGGINDTVKDRPMFDTFSNLQKETTVSDPKVNPLTGLAFDSQHSNMLPFFGGTIKQNVETFANVSVLDHHTGNSDTYRNKKEIDSLYDKSPGNIFGSQFSTLPKTRLQASRFRQSERPFDQELIAAPIAGTVENVIRPTFKSVDQLRVASKPKESYAGRTVDGKRGEVRGLVGKVDQHRPSTMYEKTQDHLFKTTGAYVASKSDSDFIMKDTCRQYQIEEYKGNGTFLAVSKPVRIELNELDNSSELISQATEAKRHHLDISNQQRNVNFHVSAQKTPSTFVVACQERETSGQRAHLLNAHKPERGLKLALQDDLKPTTKESTVEHRYTGQVSTTLEQAGKKSAYDKGIVDIDAKTTQRESMPETKYTGLPHLNTCMVYNTFTEGGQRVRDAVHAERYVGGAKRNTSEASNRLKYDNADILDRKELLVEGGRPSGPQHFQIASGISAVTLQDPKFQKLLTETESRRPIMNPNLNQAIPTKNLIGLVQQETNTSMFQKEKENNRLEDLVSPQLKDNPFYNLR
jgi:hypothetical protein